MTDNFEQLKQFIALRNKDFDKDTDSYYCVEVIRRGKDCPDLPAANRHLLNYYINKIEDLDKYKNEIVSLCNLFKARAYFSVNCKSYIQVSLDTASEFTRRIAAHDIKKPYAIWNSCSGKNHIITKSIKIILFYFVI